MVKTIHAEEIQALEFFAIDKPSGHAGTRCLRDFMPYAKNSLHRQTLRDVRAVDGLW